MAGNIIRVPGVRVPVHPQPFQELSWKGLGKHPLPIGTHPKGAGGPARYLRVRCGSMDPYGSGTVELVMTHNYLLGRNQTSPEKLAAYGANQAARDCLQLETEPPSQRRQGFVASARHRPNALWRKTSPC